MRRATACCLILIALAVDESRSQGGSAATVAFDDARLEVVACTGEPSCIQ